MNMLSIKLIDSIGEKIKEHNSTIELRSKADYVELIMPFYEEYKSNYFACCNEALDLTINYNNCTYTISNFNNMSHYKINKKIGIAYYNITLVTDFLRLKDEQYRRKKEECTTEFNSDECPICYEKLDDNVYILNCLHKFHDYCLKKYIIINNRMQFSMCNKKCPTCRHIIFKSETIFLTDRYIKTPQ